MIENRRFILKCSCWGSIDLLASPFNLQRFQVDTDPLSMKRKRVIAGLLKIVGLLWRYLQFRLRQPMQGVSRIHGWSVLAIDRIITSEYIFEQNRAGRKYYLYSSSGTFLQTINVPLKVRFLHWDQGPWISL